MVKLSGVALVKAILYMFAGFLAISGITLISIGSVVLGNIGDFKQFLSSRLMAPPVVLIVTGTIILISSIMGLLGAMKGNYCLLISYAAILTLMLFIELAVGIAMAVYKNHFIKTLKGVMKVSLIKNTEVDKDAWDIIQQKLTCCGVEAYGDWNEVKSSNWTQAGVLPPSCCKWPDSSTACRVYGTANIFSIGCFDVLKDIIRKNFNMLIVAAIGLSITKIVGIILSCSLAYNPEDEEET